MHMNNRILSDQRKITPHREIRNCQNQSNHPRLIETAVGTHFHVRQGTKTTPVFLTADGEAFWSQLPSSVCSLPGGTVQPEYTYFFILKVTGQV